MSIFTKVAVNKIKHNTFDLSHERKFNGGMGGLIPCFLAETVPNDTFRIATSQLVRFAPLVAPVMHKFSVYTHFFFVPHRILWDNWEDFINGGEDGEADPTFPTIEIDNEPVGSLQDYLGLPSGISSGPIQVSALPLAAYHRIWNEYYRDQNIQQDQSDNVALQDGPQGGSVSNNLKTMQLRAWQHDYFTSALPWTQRGPEATVPLGTEAALKFDYDAGTPSQIRNAAGGSPWTTDNFMGSENSAYGYTVMDPDDPSPSQVAIDNSGQMYADLSSATASSINDLRRAFRLQEWLELNARGGARYNETIKVHFGISPGDARLQRPEFIGGSSTPVVISEVLQTSSASNEPTPQGNMAGHGVSVGGKNTVKYTCREHGYIIGLMSVMPKSAYQQGIPKHWNKFDRFDYFWKSFANIGEQPVINKEIYISEDGENDDIFGYVPRYAEYKYINDSVHGAFRTTLDHWHAGRIFSGRPKLNGAFIQCMPGEVDRIFAVTDLNNEQFYVQMHHKVKARRPMPYFGMPTI